MSLADQIRGLRDRATAELDALEQYLTDTREVWRLVAALAVIPPQGGPKAPTGPRTLAGRSPAGELVESIRGELVRLSAVAQDYTAGYLIESTFQQSLAVFESFFGDLLAAWLAAYPDSLREKQFQFHLVLDGGDRDEVIAGVINAEVGTLLYKSLAEQFKYLADRTKIATPSAERMGQLEEAKATRNVLVHNRGVVNAAYRSLAGAAARHKLGDRVEVSEPYRREVWELVRQLVTDLSDAALTKLAPDLPPPPPPG